MEPRSDEVDPRNSLRHVLSAADTASEDPVATATSPVAQHSPAPVKEDTVQEEPIKEEDEDEEDDDGDSPDDVPTATMGDSDVPVDPASPQYTSTTTTTRRNANGSVSSVYSGNKIRHLKKEDGVPLWRKDIQFDFLKFVFEDDKAVFHKASDKTPRHTFADIYLDAMAKSSKCSKILKEKLLTERPAALNMAMVCLLVNVGRMNTTLNCKFQIFPCMICINILINHNSLSRNESSAPNLPFHTFSSGAPRPKCLQTTARCPEIKVNSQGSHGRCRATKYNRRYQSRSHTPHKSC
jgi:Ino eighty subunit 1